MSNEITVQTNLQIQNPSTGGGYKAVIQQNAQFTQAAQGQAGDVQSIPTTLTDLATSAVTTLSCAWFQNLDATNYIQVGHDNSGTLVPFLRLQPGQFCQVWLDPGVTLAAKSHTAACELWWSVWQA